jgi:succinyl-CoA synthetase alpha subunit
MSALALGTVLQHIVFVGTVREPDEGAAAHIFQLLIALQAPIIAYFAIRHLPRTPRAASAILALQCVALGCALAPVFLLHL